MAVPADTYGDVVMYIKMSSGGGVVVVVLNTTESTEKAAYRPSWRDLVSGAAADWKDCPSQTYTVSDRASSGVAAY